MQTKREPAAERPVTPLLFPAKEASIISGGSSLPLRTFQLSVRAAPLSAGRLRLLCSVVTVPPVRAAFRLFACRSCLFPGCTGIFCATRIDSSEPGLAPSRFVSMPSCSVYRRVSGRRNRIPSRCDHNAWRVCRRCEPTTSKRRERSVATSFRWHSRRRRLGTRSPLSLVGSGFRAKCLEKSWRTRQDSNLRPLDS